MLPIDPTIDVNTVYQIEICGKKYTSSGGSIRRVIGGDAVPFKFESCGKLGSGLTGGSSRGTHGRHDQMSRKVRTFDNNGSLDGMINQCFWISILQHLQRTMPSLSLSDLRSRVGLLARSNNMFDTDKTDSKGNVTDLNAAQKAADIYNLRIQILDVDSRGTVIGPRAVFAPAKQHTRHPTPIEIAQYGLDHFELVSESGKEFEPAVIFNNIFTKKRDIPISIQSTCLQLVDNEQLLYALRAMVKEDLNEIAKLRESTQSIRLSDDMNTTEKDRFASQNSSYIEKIQDWINTTQKKIVKTEKEIESLKQNIKIYNQQTPGASISQTAPESISVILVDMNSQIRAFREQAILQNVAISNLEKQINKLVAKHGL